MRYSFSFSLSLIRCFFLELMANKNTFLKTFLKNRIKKMQQLFSVLRSGFCSFHSQSDDENLRAKEKMKWVKLTSFFGLATGYFFIQSSIEVK